MAALLGLSSPSTHPPTRLLQMPPDWAEHLRYQEWREAIGTLPPDWLDTSA